MKGILFLVFIALSADARAVQTKSMNCVESDFLRGTWQDLIRLEPRIEQFLAEIGRASGEPGPVIPVTNCHVTWPVDDQGKPVEGLRTVIIDKVWFGKDQPAEGLQLTSHGGMKIIYSRKARTTYDECGNHCTRYERAVRGLVFCRTPDVCRTLGIPFADFEPRLRLDGARIPTGDEVKRPPLTFVESRALGH